MKTVKLYSGMTGEYEVIKTDASKELIEEQMKQNNIKQENDETVINPYGLLESNGYMVEVISCHDDMEINDIVIDLELDYYDY